MKLSKIAAFSLAAVALASCASEDALDVKAPAVAEQAIDFDIYSNGGSRARIYTNLDLQNEKNGFNVWANVKREGSTTISPLFTDQKVTYNKSITPKAWTYAPIKYWPTSADATVDFYAIAVDPETSFNYIDLNTDWNNKPQFNFVVNNKVAEQSDFIWAEPQLDMVRPTTEEKVKFTFQHVLQGHFFTFSTKQKDEDIKKLVVNSITITGYFAPKAKYNPDATDINDVWSQFYGDWEKRSYTISIENGGIKPDLDWENFADGKKHTILAPDGHKHKADAHYVKVSDGSVVDAPNCAYIMVLPFNYGKQSTVGKQKVTVTMNYTIYTEDADGNLIAQTNEASVDDVFDYTKPGYLHQGNIVLTLDKILFDAEVLDWNKGNDNTIKL